MTLYAPTLNSPENVVNLSWRILQPLSAENLGEYESEPEPEPEPVKRIIFSGEGRLNFSGGNSKLIFESR